MVLVEITAEELQGYALLTFRDVETDATE